jgi:hypothetical protein
MFKRLNQSKCIRLFLETSLFLIKIRIMMMMSENQLSQNACGNQVENVVERILNKHGFNIGYINFCQKKYWIHK